MGRRRAICLRQSLAAPFSLLGSGRPRREDAKIPRLSASASASAGGNLKVASSAVSSSFPDRVVGGVRRLASSDPPRRPGASAASGVSAPRVVAGRRRPDFGRAGRRHRGFAAVVAGQERIAAHENGGRLSKRRSGRVRRGTGGADADPLQALRPPQSRRCVL